MIRQAPRYLLRSTSSPLRSTPARRFISSAPPAQKSRSWKSSAARWGMAIGAIYYYNTSALFAEEPAIPSIDPKEHENALPTLESVASSRKRKDTPPVPAPESTPVTADPGLEETEEEASQEGAFNEETGEINWDCPCLGGMAHGPCGEQFRAAFSCFVFSKEEPKGMDCIEHFKTMQTCFREHPDIYGAEIDEDEEGIEDALEGQPAPEVDPLPTAASSATSPASSSPVVPETPSSTSPLASASSRSTGGADAAQRAQGAKAQVQRVQGAEQSESDSIVPKAAHDGTNANTGK